MTEIRVDVARSRRSRPFPQDERLWQADLDRAAAMIADHLEDLKDHEKQETDTQPTLAISIFGPAGSGKSSFLQTLVDDIRKGKLGYQADDSKRKIASLDILQPARFAKGDHLIYALVAAALDAHRVSQADKKLDYEVLSGVLQTYRTLADDLHAVHQEVGSSDLQPLELAAERVQRHTSGLRLQKKMTDFLNELAYDLGGQNSVILLPVDNLDLAPRHLFDSLRALQAYLLHPRLVPIFTFTDRLAEEILTEAFAESVHTAKPDQDRQLSAPGRLGVSQRLAIQYLAKCFPIRNRLRLGPAAAILQTADMISKAADNKEPEPTLMPLVAASKLLFGHSDRSTRHPVHSALRPSTLRRQFQVIDSIRQAGVGELIRKNDAQRVGLLDKVSIEPRKRKTAWGVLFDRNAWALMNIHRDVLREYHLYLEDLYSWSPHALRRVLLGALCGAKPRAQVGLWQRWHSLTDSRRSQVISLFAANAHRPWMKGEPPAGDDLRSVLLWKEAAKENEPSGGESGEDAIRKLDEVEASLIVLWFTNVTLGFYLPFSWSVYHQTRPSKEQPQHLGGAGWSLLSAPTHAAQIAHEERKIFGTGMMFLDPYSYAIALTTVPRIAACALLDEKTAELDAENEHAEAENSKQLARKVRQHKLALLTERTRGMVKSIKTLIDDDDVGKIYKSIADWEIKIPSKAAAAEKVRESLKARDYDKAFTDAEKAKMSDKVLDKIRILKATAAMVHDDQLLLRVWTCYGASGGRYWAAVSLWRGMGLIGHLIDAYRTWQKELEGDDKAKERMTQKISGLLRTHCEKGLVPGMDLGGPNPGDTLELAFSEWNTKGQRRAIWRLAERLRRWLEHVGLDHTVSPQDKGSRWSSCVVRRMHGANIVGSFWNWLDAEHLEHQGRQYSKRRKYHWNAGLALTSWIRVLLRYFEHAYEERWIFETCPLISPFLSHSARDPFLASLRELPYHKVLENNAEDTQMAIQARRNAAAEVKADSVPGPPDQDQAEDTAGAEIRARYRIADHFREVTIALEGLWRTQGESSPSLQKLAKALLGEHFESNLEENCKRVDVENLLNQILDRLLGAKADQRLKDAPVFAKTKARRDSADTLCSTAAALRGSLKEAVPDTKFDPIRYRSYLLRTFQPRIEVREGLEDERDDQFDELDPASVCYEIVRLIYHHWKVAAHASTASLFYQLPRISRDDFYDDEGKKE